MRSPGEPFGGSNFVNVSSIFVGGETGTAVSDAEALGVGVAVDFGVAVGVIVSVGVETMLSLGAGDVGDDSTAGEISICGTGVLLGVGDVAAFDGVGDGDSRGPDNEDFDFAFGVAVDLGTIVCAVRSTPRCAPRAAAFPLLAGVAEGFTRGLKEEKNDRFGVGVGVGVDAALSDHGRPNASTKLSQKILRLILSLLEQFLAKLRPNGQRSRRFAEKILPESLFAR